MRTNAMRVAPAELLGLRFVVAANLCDGLDEHVARNAGAVANGWSGH